MTQVNTATNMAIGPYAGARIALLTTNLLGDTKGEKYTDSAESAIDEAIRQAGYPDTVVWLFDCTNAGERDTVRGPWARVARDGVGDVKYTHVGSSY